MEKRKVNLIFYGLAAGALGASAALGNYFVNYAQKRTTNVPIRGQNPKIKDALLGEDEKSKQVCNEQTEITKKWLKDVKCERVKITSRDYLSLSGVVFNSPIESHKWVVLIHGYSSKKEKMYNYARHYNENNFNVLAIDLRAHGESEGEYVGMGWKDRDDIILWLSTVIAARDIDAEIVVHGVSMGAAAVMMVSGAELPENVKVLIEDCGYTSAWDIFASQLGLQFNLQPFPLLYIASAVSKVKLGYSYTEANSLMQLEMSHTPILFIHGEKDGFVPVEMAKKAFEVTDTDKRLLIVDNATHANSVYEDWHTYWSEVDGFVKKYIK